MGNPVLLGAFTKFLAWGGLTIAVGAEEQGFWALVRPRRQSPRAPHAGGQKWDARVGALAVDASGHVYVSGGFSGSLAYAGSRTPPPSRTPSSFR